MAALKAADLFGRNKDGMTRPLSLRERESALDPSIVISTETGTMALQRDSGLKVVAEHLKTDAEKASDERTPEGQKAKAEKEKSTFTRIVETIQRQTAAFFENPIVKPAVTFVKSVAKTVGNVYEAIIPEPIRNFIEKPFTAITQLGSKILNGVAENPITKPVLETGKKVLDYVGEKIEPVGKAIDNGIKNAGIVMDNGIQGAKKLIGAINPFDDKPEEKTAVMQKSEKVTPTASVSDMAIKAGTDLAKSFGDAVNNIDLNPFDNKPAPAAAPKPASLTA